MTDAACVLREAGRARPRSASLHVTGLELRSSVHRKFDSVNASAYICASILRLLHLNVQGQGCTSLRAPQADGECWPVALRAKHQPWQPRVLGV
jgi:hypothetical protein